MRTQSVIVRLPSDLVEKIDMLIEMEIFPSRANFVLGSILDCVSRMLQHLETDSWKLAVLDKPLKMDFLRGMIVRQFDEDRREYLSYSGDPVRINVRVPNGIMDIWSDVCRFSNNPFAFQDFVRYSTIRHLKNWYKALQGKYIAGDFIHAELTTEEEEALREIIRGDPPIFYDLDNKD